MNGYGAIIVLLLAMSMYSCDFPANHGQVGVVDVDSGVFIVSLNDSVLVPLVKIDQDVNAEVWAVDSTRRVFLVSEDRNIIYVYKPIGENAYEYEQELAYNDEAEIRDLLVVGNKLLVGGYREGGNLWSHRLWGNKVSMKDEYIGNVGGIKKGIDHLLILGNELIAIDNLVFPIYVLKYQMSDREIISTEVVEMPTSRPYEHYFGAVADGTYLYTLSTSTHRGGTEQYFQVYDSRANSIAYVFNRYRGTVELEFSKFEILDLLSDEKGGEVKKQTNTVPIDSVKPLGWNESFVCGGTISDSLVIDNEPYKSMPSENAIEKIYESNGSVYLLHKDGTTYRGSFESDKGMIYQRTSPLKQLQSRGISALLWLNGKMIYVLTANKVSQQSANLEVDKKLK